MSLPRFFLETQVIAQETEASFPLELAADDAKHFRVLRLGPGEHIAVVDGASDYFECRIEGFEGNVPVVSVARHVDAPKQRVRVTLCQGLAKGDKMDTVIRHATELGVSAFMPFSSMRSIVKLDEKKARTRTERWRSIAKSAAMQSGQMSIPAVEKPASFTELCQSLADFDAVCICWEEAPQTAALADAIAPAISAFEDGEPARVAIVVGPEGGIDSVEVDALLACNGNARLVSLGASILRTETAGIVAPALALYELGQLGRR